MSLHRTRRHYDENLPEQPILSDGYFRPMNVEKSSACLREVAFVRGYQQMTASINFTQRCFASLQVFDFPFARQLFLANAAKGIYSH